MNSSHYSTPRPKEGEAPAIGEVRRRRRPILFGRQKPERGKHYGVNGQAMLKLISLISGTFGLTEIFKPP